jgi:hypothetical protein
MDRLETGAAATADHAARVSVAAGADPFAHVDELRGLGCLDESEGGLVRDDHFGGCGCEGLGGGFGWWLSGSVGWSRR